MTGLPGWLIDVRETIPLWLSALAHGDGPGRYRFALEAYEPYDIDSSAMACNIRNTLAGTPPEAERRTWVDYLLDLQRPEDGLVIDAGMERHTITEGAEPTAEEIANVRRWTSRNALVTVLHLGGLPRYRLAHEEAFGNPEEVVAYLEGLHWHNPWGAGSWAGAIILFQHFNRCLGDPNAEANIRAGVDWLAARQDLQTGAWSDGSETPLFSLINGIFKVWIQVLPVADLPVQYPERVIDLCLRGLREDPVLSGTPDACSIFDVALVLDTALRYCDHRRDEVAEATSECFGGFEPLLRSDGAFSYGPDGSLANHGGLALAPVKDQSDLTGTALCCCALALLTNLCGLRDELSWTPITEWSMKLQSRG